MSQQSQGPRLNHLVAIAASLALAGGALASPGLAAATAATAHVATVAHHTAKAVHKSKSVHKTAAAGKRGTRSVKIVHHTAAKAVHNTKQKTVTQVKKTQKTVTPVKKAVAPVKHTVTTPAAQPTPAPAPVAAPADCVNGSLIPTSANIALVRTATICLVNQQRALAGLAPLVESAALDAAAQGHSDDMVANDYFDHVAPSGADVLSRVVAAGFATVDDVLDLGENIAAASGSLATPEATVASWMASPPHRANILDPTFRQTGLGITAAVPASLGLGGSGATYTQTFGTAA
jgi:uncharacterized protein YkwD